VNFHEPTKYSNQKLLLPCESTNNNNNKKTKFGGSQTTLDSLDFINSSSSKKSISPENQISREIQKTSIKLFKKCSLQFSFDRPENRKNSTEKGLKKNKGKGERRG
jgi:hypothetical protein